MNVPMLKPYLLLSDPGCGIAEYRIDSDPQSCEKQFRIARGYRMGGVLFGFVFFLSINRK